MWTKYDESELIEFFRSLPVYIEPREAGQLIFSSIGANNIQLSMLISAYEKKCKISLDIENSPIFNVELDDVEEIKLNEKCDSVLIYQAKKIENFTVYNIKGSFAIALEKRNDIWLL